MRRRLRDAQAPLLNPHHEHDIYEPVYPDRKLGDAGAFWPTAPAVHAAIPRAKRFWCL